MTATTGLCLDQAILTAIIASNDGITAEEVQRRINSATGQGVSIGEVREALVSLEGQGMIRQWMQPGAIVVYCLTPEAVALVDSLSPASLVTLPVRPHLPTWF